MDAQRILLETWSELNNISRRLEEENIRGVTAQGFGRERPT
jgi:hypothetical protein